MRPVLISAIRRGGRRANGARLPPLALIAVAALAFVAGCPKAPRAVLASISSADDLCDVKDAFNADVEHRRVLVLLSPT